jgi:hypothetical protein
MKLPEHLSGDGLASIQNIKISATTAFVASEAPAAKGLAFQGGRLFLGDPSTGSPRPVSQSLDSVTSANGSLNISRNDKLLAMAIAEASPSTSGLMPPSLFARLNSATEAATENTIARRDGSGNASFNEITTTRLTGLSSPVGGSDATTLGYVTTEIDSATAAIATGFSFWKPCRVAATTNLALSGLQVIDGVSLLQDDRVLATGQANPADNGIFRVVEGGEWIRTSDFDEGATANPGSIVAIAEGTENGDYLFILDADGTLTVGVSPLTFTRLSKISDISVGHGLHKSSPTKIEISPGYGTTAVVEGLKVLAANGSIVVDEAGISVSPLYLDGLTWLSDPTALNDALTNSYSSVFGNGVDKNYTFIHGGDTWAIDMDRAIVYDIASGHEVFCRIYSTDENSITVSLSEPPATNSLQIVLKSTKKILEEYSNTWVFEDGSTLYHQGLPPDNPSAGDYWHDTTPSSVYRDWVWNGSNWIGLTANTASEAIETSSGIGIALVSEFAGLDIYLDRLDVEVDLQGTNDASNYWTFQAKSFEPEAAIGSTLTTQSETIGYAHIGQDIGAIAANPDIVTVEISPIGNPGSFVAIVSLTYRPVYA